MEPSLQQRSNSDRPEAPNHQADGGAISAPRSTDYCLRGHQHRLNGELDQALIEFEQALRLDPACADAYNNRGNIFFARADYERAIADYSEAIRHQPGLATAYVNRALAYARLGRYDQAVADASAALGFDARLAGAHFIRGVAHAAKGRLDQAIADFTEALRLDPKNPLTYNDRALAFISKGDYARAISDCDQALRLNPRLVLAHDNRAHACLLKGEPEHAVAGFTRVLQLDPQHPTARFDRGVANLAAGRHFAAAADFGEVLKRQPTNTAARANYDRAVLLASSSHPPTPPTPGSGVALAPRELPPRQLPRRESTPRELPPRESMAPRPTPAPPLIVPVSAPHPPLQALPPSANSRPVAPPMEKRRVPTMEELLEVWDRPIPIPIPVPAVAPRSSAPDVTPPTETRPAAAAPTENGRRPIAASLRESVSKRRPATDRPKDVKQPDPPRSRTSDLVGTVALLAAGAALLAAPFASSSRAVVPFSVAAVFVGLLGLLRVLSRRNGRVLFPAAGTAAGAAVLLTAWLAPGVLGPTYRASRVHDLTESAATRVVPLLEGSFDAGPRDPDWVDASKAALQQGSVRVQVSGVSVGPVNAESARLNRQLPARCLFIHLRVHQVELAADFAARAHQAQPADAPLRPRPRLTDNTGKHYSLLEVADPAHRQAVRSSVFPVSFQSEVFAFDVPAAGVEYLRLEVPADAWGGKSAFRFTIPAAMIRQAGPA